MVTNELTPLGKYYQVGKTYSMSKFVNLAISSREPPGIGFDNDNDLETRYSL